MKKQDFLQLMDRYGIDLDKLSITIGRLSGWEGAHGVYEKNGEWIYFSADGRNHIDQEVLSGEEEAFDQMAEEVFADLADKGYLTRQIDESVAMIPREQVCAFLRDTYGMTEKQALSAWEYLKQDMHVLLEFKYYMAKGSFVPEKYACRIQGYCAEELHRTTYLEVLGAFNYLIYLKNKPREALANLEKGLPRRIVYSDAELEAMRE